MSAHRDLEEAWHDFPVATPFFVDLRGMSMSFKGEIIDIAPSPEDVTEAVYNAMVDIPDNAAEVVLTPARNYRAIHLLQERLYERVLGPVAPRKHWVADKDWTQRQPRRRRSRGRR